MKISRDLTRFHLHDGSLERILYQPDLRQLTLMISLCQWNGESGPDEFHSHAVTMTFYEVEQFKTDPPLDRVKWLENFSLTILHFGYKPGLNTSHGEGVWGLIEVPMPRNLRQEMLIMEFVASDFEWTPDA